MLPTRISSEPDSAPVRISSDPILDPVRVPSSMNPTRVPGSFEPVPMQSHVTPTRVPGSAFDHAPVHVPHSFEPAPVRVSPTHVPHSHSSTHSMFRAFASQPEYHHHHHHHSDDQYFLLSQPTDIQLQPLPLNWPSAPAPQSVTVQPTYVPRTETEDDTCCLISCFSRR